MKKQINIQLEQKDFDLLEAAVFLHRLKSPQELIRPLVEALLSELASDPAIARAVAERHDPTQSAEAGKVTALGSRRPKRVKKSAEPNGSA